MGGHADSSGRDAVNEPLSEARARAVVERLVSRGIPAPALTARPSVGTGEARGVRGARNAPLRVDRRSVCGAAPT